MWIQRASRHLLDAAALAVRRGEHSWDEAFLPTLCANQTGCYATEIKEEHRAPSLRYALQNKNGSEHETEVKLYHYCCPSRLKLPRLQTLFTNEAQLEALVPLGESRLFHPVKFRRLL